MINYVIININFIQVVTDAHNQDKNFNKDSFNINRNFVLKSFSPFFIKRFEYFKLSQMAITIVTIKIQDFIMVVEHSTSLFNLSSNLILLQLESIILYCKISQLYYFHFYLLVEYLIIPKYPQLYLEFYFLLAIFQIEVTILYLIVDLMFNFN